MSKFEIGTKVHYLPFEDCKESDMKNGIVKSVAPHTTKYVFVVINCAGDWENYQDYTGQLTSKLDLREGWVTK